MRFSTRTVGDRAERRAAQALRRAGYRILLRNVRTPAGEIDIVAERRGVIVFAEVKARRVGGMAGSGAEALTARKLSRVARAASHVLRSRGLSGCPRAFLGIAVELDEAGRPGKVLFHPVEEIR